MTTRQEETLAEELSRLVQEWKTAEWEREREEAWNLIADFATANHEAICKGLRLVDGEETP